MSLMFERTGRQKPFSRLARRHTVSRQHPTETPEQLFRKRGTKNTGPDKEIRTKWSLHAVREEGEEERKGFHVSGCKLIAAVGYLVTGLQT